jgi:murein DD-endopeptidase MepM/ murein hydrolase activator NlpD
MEFTRPQQVIYPQPLGDLLAPVPPQGCTGQVRWFAVLVAGLLVAAPARAEGDRFDWPLRPRPAVVRGFDSPTPNWTRGHRGVDLAGSENQPVFAAGRGTVVFAGQLAGRPVVSIAHPGGLRTSYEPVRPSVQAGQVIVAGAQIGTLASGHPDCAQSVCLHWGAMWGPASAAGYVDPLGLLAGTPIRLKPVGG